MTETGTLDLTRAAFRRRRARRAPVATLADGITPSDGPPTGPDVLVECDMAPYWGLNPERLEALRADLAILLGMRALGAGLVPVEEVGFDLVWRYWRLPWVDQKNMRIHLHPWPFRCIGNLGEHVYLRAWQRVASGGEA
ncbi:hypothetical protein [Streptomyces sp. NPDC046821]|uniref:hypothetical protein n=1 Tax=Streptomyces sp. NPDC046821 TaxID=3154702 RepID=UPI0033FB5B56